MVKAPTYLSDHSQIVTWINTHKIVEATKDNPSQPSLEKLPRQYIWTADSKETFIKQLKSNEIQRKLVHRFIAHGIQNMLCLCQC